MMKRYIKVEWPYLHEFQQLPEYEELCYECIQLDEPVAFVSEDLYYRVMIIDEITHEE